MTLAGILVLSSLIALFALVARTRRWVQECTEVDGFVASDPKLRRNQKLKLSLVKFTDPQGVEQAINSGVGGEKGTPVKVLVHPSGKAKVRTFFELYGLFFYWALLAVVFGSLLLHSGLAERR